MAAAVTDVSVGELKSRVYGSLRSAGVLDALKTQLRSQVLRELRKHSGDSVLEAGEPARRENPFTLWQRGVNLLIAEYLRLSEYSFTLSVFLPESGAGSEYALARDDVLRLLRLNPRGGRIQRIAQETGRPQSPEHAMIFQLLDILAGPEASRVVETATQTSEDSGISEPLDLKLRRVDDAAQNEGEKISVATLEERMARYQRQVDEQSEAEIQARVERIREIEIARMRSEEQARMRHELLATREELERGVQERLQQLRAQETELEKRFSRRQQELETSLFEQRQRLMGELERLRAQEDDAKRAAALADRAVKLREDHAREKEERAAQAVAEAEKLRERLLHEAAEARLRAKQAADDAYTTRLAEVDRRMHALADLEERLQRERDAHAVLVAGATEARAALASAERELGLARLRNESLASELAAVRGEVKAVMDAAVADKTAAARLSVENAAYAQEAADLRASLAGERQAGREREATLQARITDLTSRLEEASRALHEERASRAMQAEQWREEGKKYAAERQALRRAEAELLRERASLAAKIDADGDTLEELKRQVEDSSIEIKALQRELQDARRSQASAQSALEATTQLSERLKNELVAAQEMYLSADIRRSSRSTGNSRHHLATPAPGPHSAHPGNSLLRGIAQQTQLASQPITPKPGLDLGVPSQGLLDAGSLAFAAREQRGRDERVRVELEHTLREVTQLEAEDQAVRDASERLRRKLLEDRTTALRTSLGLGPRQSSNRMTSRSCSRSPSCSHSRHRSHRHQHRRRSKSRSHERHHMHRSRRSKSPSMSPSSSSSSSERSRSLSSSPLTPPHQDHRRANASTKKRSDVKGEIRATEKGTHHQASMQRNESGGVQSPRELASAWASRSAFPMHAVPAAQQPASRRVSPVREHHEDGARGQKAQLHEPFQRARPAGGVVVTSIVAAVQNHPGEHASKERWADLQVLPSASAATTRSEQSANALDVPLPEILPGGAQVLRLEAVDSEEEHSALHGEEHIAPARHDHPGTAHELPLQTPKVDSVMIEQKDTWSSFSASQPIFPEDERTASAEKVAPERLEAHMDVSCLDNMAAATQEPMASTDLEQQPAAARQEIEKPEELQPHQDLEELVDAQQESKPQTVPGPRDKNELRELKDVNSSVEQDDEGVGKERQPVEVEKKDLVPESEHHELEGAKDAAILHLRERDRQLQEMAELEAEMRRQREDRDRRRREAEEEDRARREMESIARREAERLAEAEREAKAREEQLLREADERERKEQEMREVEATLAQYLAQRRRGTEDDEGIVSAPAVGEDLAERSTEMSEHTAISANSSGLDDQAVPPLASSSAPQAASSSPSAAGLEDSTGAISIKSFGSDEAW